MPITGPNKKNRILRTSLSTLLLSMLVPAGAGAAITDGKFGTAQAFDVQYYWSDATTLNVSGMTRPYASGGQLSSETVEAMAANGQYFSLFQEPDDDCSSFRLGIFNADGSLAEQLHESGTVTGLDDDLIFYLGSGFYGTIFTPSLGYEYGNSATFSVGNTNPSCEDFAAFVPPSSTPLDAGETPDGGNGGDGDVAPSEPTQLLPTPDDGAIDLSFVAPTSSGSDPITAYEYEIDGSGLWLPVTGDTSPLRIEGLANGTTYSIRLRAVSDVGPGDASEAVSVTLPDIQGDLARFVDTVDDFIADTAIRDLQATIAANRKLLDDAHKRFAERSDKRCSAANADGDACVEPSVAQEVIPLDVDGFAVSSAGVLSSKGTFEQGRVNGVTGRSTLVFGDFDVRHDANEGNTAANLSARMVYEQFISSQTLLGYSVGAEIAHSDQDGDLSGTQSKVGMLVGVHAIHKLGSNVFADGFVSVGAGKNNLDVEAFGITAEGDYASTSATVGLALTSEHDGTWYRFRPQLGLSYGRTWLEDANLLVNGEWFEDESVTLEADAVSLGLVTLRPEFLVPLDGERVADSVSLVKAAPRFVCEAARTDVARDGCGAGVEFGIESQYSDGLGSFEAHVSTDRINGRSVSVLQLSVQQRF